MRSNKECHLFRRKLAAHIKQHGNRFWEHYSAKYIQMSTEETQQSNLELKQKLSTLNQNLIFRGTIGNIELRHAMETDRLGRDFSQSGKSLSFDLVSYIRDNDSAYFLSATGCPMTAKPYASCIAKMPCRGYIFVMGLPKVYTIPQKLLRINKELFSKYDDQMLNDSHNMENGGTKYTPISDIVKNNNETTIILTDFFAKKNWRPTLSKDVAQVFEVCGPGRILGSMMSFTRPILISEIHNTTFRNRQISVEVVLNCEKKLEEYTKKAQNQGLIAEGNRIVTIQDATALDNAGLLDHYIENSDTQETLRLNQVPAHIPIGHQSKLVEYALQQLQQSDITNNMLRRN